MIRPVDVNGMKCDAARDMLAELIEKLNELDEVDYFGTEGWRQMLLGDDD